MQFIKYCVIVCFLFFICSPWIQYFGSIVTVQGVNENRTKVQWPEGDIWEGLWDGDGYSTKVERYFLDHFPLRDLMLRSLGQLEYSALGRSREVIVGKDGWLADKKVVSEQIHQTDHLTDEQIKIAVLQLKRLQYWLQNRGTDFLMVIIPMKPTVYPEKFPERYTQRPNVIGLQRFQKALARNDVPFLDVLRLLKKHKDEMPVYYKTDMHFNTVGSYYVAQAIVNYFSTRILGHPIWNEPIKKQQTSFSGGELTAMPLFFPQPEMTPIWTSNRGVYTETFLEEPTKINVYKVPFAKKHNRTYELKGEGITRALLPPSIMFGNSFMLRYPPVGYHNYFTESSRVLDYQFFSKVLDYVQPKHKIFILHIYESQLLFHITPPDNFHYWDKRIKDLPLPKCFKYK